MNTRSLRIPARFPVSILPAVAALLAVITAFPAAAAIPARGYTGTQIFSTVGADKDEGEPNHCGEPGGASSWFFYQAPTNGVMVMDTLGSSFDTVLAVYTGPGTNFESLVPVACNNDAGETATWSRVTFATTAATVYYVAVDGVGGVSGTVQLNYELTAHEPLTITTQPQSQVVGIASTATFTVHATGTGPLNYQWRRNGTPLTHPNSNTLLLPGVRSEDEAEYVAVVSDFNGSTSSAPATLTVCSVVPATNHVAVEQVWLEGQPCMRVAGHAAAGAVLEASSDLRQWQPVCTNQSALGLFSFDDPALMPRRFYRILLP